MSKKSKKNVPQLRFPEFTEKWQKKTLKEISISGFSNGVFNDPSKVGRGYRLINVKDMYSGESIDIDTLTRLELDEKEFLKNRASYGDIFFTRSSLVKEGIAHSNVLLSRAEDITYDGHLIKLSPRQNTYLPQFIAAALKNSTSRKQLVARGKTGTMTTIGQDDIATVKLTIPSIAEQEKIASFLAAVDTRLAQLRRKHELLQTYKRGVMQKLFSQRIRFKCDDGKPFPDWEEKRLESVCTMTSSKRIYLEEYVKDGIPFYRGKEVTELKQGKKPNDILYISRNKYEEIREKYGIPIAGDILVTAVGTLGNVWRINRNYDFYFKDGNLIWLKNISTNSIFLAILLQENTEELIKTSIGSTQKALTIVELKKISLNFPCLQEQKKIADFLTMIDKKIEAIAQQIELTEQFKKGLLQKMFV